MDTVKHVLIVDDDEAILGTLELALSGEGYPVLKASDGAAALDVVQRQLPGLILLDMKMPVMDGWAFAHAYRQEPGPRAPIVVVTAARDAAQRAAEIGAEGYLAKPFDIDDLLDVVARFLADDHALSVPMPGPGAPPPEESPASE